MLATWVDSVLADFTRRRILFSHRDIADRIPNLLPQHVDDVRRLVFERMVGQPAYRLSLAHFVGEGLILLCIPRESAPTSNPVEATVFEVGHLVG